MDTRRCPVPWAAGGSDTVTRRSPRTRRPVMISGGAAAFRARWARRPGARVGCGGRAVQVHDDDRAALRLIHDRTRDRAGPWPKASPLITPGSARRREPRVLVVAAAGEPEAGRGNGNVVARDPRGVRHVRRTVAGRRDRQAVMRGGDGAVWSCAGGAVVRAWAGRPSRRSARLGGTAEPVFRPAGSRPPRGRTAACSCRPATASGSTAARCRNRTRAVGRAADESLFRGCRVSALSGR
jgi:hypothetical protein